MAGKYIAVFSDGIHGKETQYRFKIEVVDRHISKHDDGCYFRIRIPALDLQALIPRVMLSAPVYQIWDCISDSPAPFRVLRVPNPVWATIAEGSDDTGRYAPLKLLNCFGQYPSTKGDSYYAKWISLPESPSPFSTRVDEPSVVRLSVTKSFSGDSPADRRCY